MTGTPDNYYEINLNEFAPQQFSEAEKWKIGDRLRDARKKRKISQDKLALALNVNRETLSNWENGKTLPSLEDLFNISRCLDLKMCELLGEEITSSQIKEEFGLDEEFQRYLRAYVTNRETDKIEFLKDFVTSKILQEIFPKYKWFSEFIDKYINLKETYKESGKVLITQYGHGVKFFDGGTEDDLKDQEAWTLNEISRWRRDLVLTVAECMETLQEYKITGKWTPDFYMHYPDYIMERIIAQKGGEQLPDLTAYVDKEDADIIEWSGYNGKPTATQG